MPEASSVVVNGVVRVVADDPDRTLLDWLRDDLGLTGTKYGCGESACGACSVLVDGELARACVVPVTDVVGRTVTTVEGLAAGGDLTRVQRAIVEVGAVQCGYCTPGMVMAATALLAANPHPSEDEIVEWMSPNLCRCGTYPRLVEAITLAAVPAAALPSVAVVSPGSVSLTPVEVRPRRPWDLTPLDERDWFAVLGDGLVAVAAPPDVATGMWSPTGGAWVHVDAERSVRAFTGKVEVGQGTRRALRLLVAEELGVAVDDVDVVVGDTDVCPFDIGTFGSLAMPTAAPDLRRAAAAAGDALAPSGRPEPGTRRVVVAPPDQRVRSADTWTVAGHARPIADPAAVTGARRFPSDLTRPGLLHGKVLRPPSLGARLRSADVTAARSLPGVTVVAEDGFVGVAAPTPARAAEAIAAVEAAWDLAPVVDGGDLESWLRTHPADPTEAWGGPVAEDVGDVEAAMAHVATRLDATYTTAPIAHAPMETRVALADWAGGRLTVWAGTQTPFRVRHDVADALGVPEADVRVVVPDTGTGFGGKHEPDVAIGAARLARAAGAPVRLHWTREEEFRWAYVRPPAVVDVRVGATSDGDLIAWELVNVNSGAAALGMPHYRVPNQRLRFEPAESPLRQGSYRALAATANTFARECALDEVAHELGADPLDLRLRNLSDERLVAVLRAATDRFGWDVMPRDDGVGRGLAVGFEKGGRVATCALVDVDGDRLRIQRIVTAFECGAVVDRDNLVNQIQGATVMGLGGALFEAVHLRDGQVTNPRFSDYRLPRFGDVPPIEVVLVDRPDVPPAGAGETPIIAVAPALANALFAATGRRVRRLPLLADGPLRLAR